MEIVRISVIGIAGILLAVLVKEVGQEYAFYITMAAGLAIYFFQWESYPICWKPFGK